MKNITDNALGFGAVVIGPGETYPTADLTPEAQEWYLRHGCVEDGPAGVPPVDQGPTVDMAEDIFMDMTRGQLIDYAREHDFTIAGLATMRKDDILEAVRAAAKE